MSVAKMTEEIYLPQEPPWRCAFCYGLFETAEKLARFESKPFHLACLGPLLEARGIPEAILACKQGEKRKILGYQPRHPRPEIF